MISALGVGSGLDLSSLVSQLVAAEGDAKTFYLANKRSGAEAEISAFGALKSALSSFKTSTSTLNDKSTFSARKFTSSETDVFTVSGINTVAASTYDIEVVDFAEAHKLLSLGYANDSATIGKKFPNKSLMQRKFW